MREVLSSIKDSTKRTISKPEHVRRVMMWWMELQQKTASAQFIKNKDHTKPGLL